MLCFTWNIVSTVTDGIAGHIPLLPDYFPRQNLLKIRSRTSSVVMAPVIEPICSTAL